ncbi:uncharacterized protein ACIBXB_005933 isoform 2-T2 [Morphnus guianensis]
MIYDKNDADFEDKVKQLMEVTGKNQDECIVALHDCNGDVNRAINILLEGISDTMGKWQPEREVRTCKRNKPADTKVSEERGGGGAPGARAEIPCGEDHGEAGCPPAVHGGPRWSRYPPCSPWRTPCRSRWVPEGGCDPVGTPRWSRLLAGPADLWREEPTEQVFWQDL